MFRKSVICRLRHILQFVSVDYEQLLEDKELTPLQFEILLFVSEAPRAIGDIADWFWLDRSTASRLLDRLLNDGWIMISKDPNDKRRKLVSLLKTPDILDSVNTIYASWRAIDTNANHIYGLGVVDLESQIVAQES